MLAIQSLTVLNWHQLLESVDCATGDIAVENCWLVALNTVCVTGAATEDAGQLCLEGAVSTLMAMTVTSSAPEVMQSLLCELDGPGQELSREDLLSRACQFSHSVCPVSVIHLFVGVTYWLRCPALFSGPW